MRRGLILLCTGMLFTLTRGADFDARFAAIRTQATPAQLYAFLYDLPKGGDLHNHSQGANLPEWMFTVLTDPARNGGDEFWARVRFGNCADSLMPFVKFRTIRRATWAALPECERAEYTALTALSPDERAAWHASFVIEPPHEGRDEFFLVSIWTRLGDILRNPAVRFELLADNIKAFGAEKVRYLELQFSVFGLADNDNHPIATDAALALLRARLARTDVTSTGVVVRFQETVLRFAPNAEAALRTQYAFVDAHRDLWVGLNMAGIEDNGHGFPRRFLTTFRDVRRRYPALPLSIHAGEMDGPNHHIRDTLLLGATRIGHGLNLIQDEDTLLLLQQSQRVLVETNLISNQLLEYVPDLARHPFPEYLRTGIPVCLNTDDRGMWSSNMTDEYFTAVTAFNLSWAELVQLGRNSLTFAFVEPEVKARLLADYERDVAAFAAAYGRGTVDDALARLAAVKPVTYEYAKRTWGLTFH